MQFQPSRRTGTRKMKLYQNRVLGSFLFSFYSFSSAKLNIECERDNLVISLPLNNENIANILELNAGNCTHENIPNGVENAISYSNCFAEIQIPSKECDLINTYSSSKMRTSGDFYMPTVNFSLGLLQGDTKLYFEEFQITVECGIETSYEVHLDYNAENRQEEPDCEMVNGTCVFYGQQFENAVFRIMETDANYTQNLTNFGNNPKKPGEPIYVKIIAEYVPPGYDWVVSECFNTNLDTNVTVQLIDPKEVEYNGVCSWDAINLVSE